MSNELKPLMLGGLEIKVPIIQGGMGVAISTASLASAVANCGGAGTIASVGLGYGSQENETDFVKASRKGLQSEIRKAKKITKGIIGANILVAVSNYEDLVQVVAEEKADFLVSGAGLPLKLPEYVEGYSVKIIPIVSSARAAAVILKAWKKRYDRFPDAIVVEGPLAGGHLGFQFEELTPPKDNMLELLVIDVLKVVCEYEKEYKRQIPVIAAGGIFDGKDAARFFKLGVKAVQIATRFVATHECSVPDEFKKLYLDARKEDIVIIKSPVGLPGRSLKTSLIKRVVEGKREAFRCNYRCLKTCDPSSAPYCIAKALFNAVTGKIDDAVVFAGSNVYRINKIVSVKELIDEIVGETIVALKKS
ncbi:MAG: nitronate monooxygenase family protein [Candidatus Omnitrophica bacterium]|nr:nitronate monooxygenase family protein [Candidatus Omnitrophota bacterium]